MFKKEYTFSEGYTADGQVEASEMVVLKMKKEHEYEVKEHLLSIEELTAEVKTKVDTAAPSHSWGLDADEAHRRLQTNGKNILSPPKQTPEIVKFLLEFTNLFMILLAVAGVLSIVAYLLDRTQVTVLLLHAQNNSFPSFQTLVEQHLRSYSNSTSILEWFYLQL